MNENARSFLIQIWFIFICGIGGFFLSLMGISIGWIIGSLLIACSLSLWPPKGLGIHEKGLSNNWFKAGQCLLGIELGRNMNMSVMTVFQDNWLTVLIVLLLSIAFSLGTGLVLYKYSRADMLTSFLATSPGGVATMPTIADDIGANVGIVSAVQAIRVFLVVTIIPVFLFFIVQRNSSETTIVNNQVETTIVHFEWVHVIWTVIITVVALFGVKVGKRIKLPAPWLIGSLLGVIIFDAIYTVFTNETVVFWWPHFIVVLGQILIGTNIGARFRKSMFVGLKRILIVSTAGTLLLIFAMLISSYLVSIITGLSFVTSVLALAPGGVVEMATASVLLQADSTFVVAVQTLRIIMVIMIVPPFIRFVHERKSHKKDREDVSSAG